VPLFLETRTVDTALIGEQTVGVRLNGNGKTAYYIPGCAQISNDLLARISDADLLFFDGMLWQDDEVLIGRAECHTGWHSAALPRRGLDPASAA